MFIDTIFPKKSVNYQPTSIHFPKHKSIENLATSLILSQSQLSAHCVPVPHIYNGQKYTGQNLATSLILSQNSLCPPIYGGMSCRPNPHTPTPSYIIQQLTFKSICFSYGFHRLCSAQLLSMLGLKSILRSPSLFLFKYHGSRTFGPRQTISFSPFLFS